MLKHMKNDIQITVANESNDVDFDDNWDPMKDEYNDPNINTYQHGPGADLDIKMQHPAYRDKNNQIVWKLKVNNIPRGLTKTGLENLFLNFGTACVSKFQAEADDRLKFAIIEYKSLLEAQNAIVSLGSNPIFGKMRVNFALSDEEDTRRKKKLAYEEKLYWEMQEQLRSVNQSALQQDKAPGKINRHSHIIKRMLGRGLNPSRGRVILSACREGYEKRAGLHNCMWSNGIPDFRDSSGILYDPRSEKYSTSNRVLQNIVVTAVGSSNRKVAMGRGFVPPVVKTDNTNPETIQQGRIGVDLMIPIQSCVHCGSETPLKCSQCGTPYCSVKCQKIDFRRHRHMCTPKESIDILLDPTMQATMRSVPLCQKDAPHSTSTNILPNCLWGKPKKNVVSLLQKEMEPILVINFSEDSKYYGTLSCLPVFEVCQKLCTELPEEIKSSCVNTLTWPSLGMLVAVRCFESIWRGYVIAVPCLGSSTKYTVALCDFGQTVKVDIVDMFSLSAVYHDLPELAVTCEVIQAVPNEFREASDFHLKILSCSANKVTATILGENKLELGVVSLSPWGPSCVMELTSISIEPPCMVVVTAYHHQGAVYVRPVGKNYQEQLFSLMQEVAAVHVTTPPLGRPPYKGEMVACRYKKDGNFYRAIVSEAASPNEYSVIFVDFGNLDIASGQDMKPLPQELKTCPCMAIRVSLKGVRHGPLTENAVQLLNRISLKEQQFKLDCSRQSVEGVELFYPDNRSLNTQLQELLMPEWEVQMKKGAEPHRGEVFLLENMPVLPLLKDGQKKGTASIVVSRVMLDGRIAACPIDRPEVEHVLQTLFYQINEYCEATDPNTVYNPRVHEVCLAKYTDGMWYRAVNIDTNKDSPSCQVFFLDFGNIEEVEFKDIRRMVPDFVPIPVIMSMCLIDGTPCDPTVKVVKRINELVTINKTYEVEILETIELGEYKIHMPEISDQLTSEFRQ